MLGMLCRAQKAHTMHTDMSKYHYFSSVYIAVQIPSRRTGAQLGIKAVLRIAVLCMLSRSVVQQNRPRSSMALHASLLLMPFWNRVKQGNC